jgi:uncharacterized protein DUF5679
MPTATETPASQTETTAPGSRKARRRFDRKHAAIVAKLATADKLVTKRRAQLEAASQQRASLAAQLARLSTADGATTGPTAYCLKDRMQVTIGEPQAVVLANGRSAIAGTCPTCGSRLVRIVAR